jgi:hypothetical protein
LLPLGAKCSTWRHRPLVTFQFSPLKRFHPQFDTKTPAAQVALLTSALAVLLDHGKHAAVEENRNVNLWNKDESGISHD